VMEHGKMLIHLQQMEVLLHFLVLLVMVVGVYLPVLLYHLLILIQDLILQHMEQLLMVNVILHRQPIRVLYLQIL